MTPASHSPADADVAPRRPLVLFPVAFAAAAMVVFTATRLALAVRSGLAEFPLPLWPRAFAVGFGYDLAAAIVLASPLVLWEAVAPGSWRRSIWHLWLRRGVFAGGLFGLLFLGAAEWFFWEEFTTRFNFIAVDYLVYTREVVGNIRESYPVPAILTGCALFSVAATILLRRLLAAGDAAAPSPRARLGLAAVALALPLLATLATDVDRMGGSGSATADELSGNGLVTFLAAYRRNELDYDRFYATLPQERADAILARLGVERTAYGAGADADQAPDESGEPIPPYLVRRPRNVVLVSIESLSASFVGAYGSRDGLTPNLDRLAAGGLVFANAFATGTRTVRGLESLSLGTPPIPGQAVVRRPGNDHLETLGGILHHQGFATRFLYGGYGLFDNMNAYFAANDYDVVDRTDFPAESIAAENVWGVADESLFANTLVRLDADAASGRPFFAHVMTTSNHRPYTFPEGRIDLPQGTRRGAVKYTDWALGAFVEQARTRPWFADTLFVFVADHCASVAGRTELPLAKYRIPLVFYAPGIVRPGRVEEPISQIDVPPTLLDALGKDGDDYFFGRESGAGDPGDGRVFISNYQSLGYYKRDTLVVLKPRRKVETFRVDPVTLETTPAPVDPTLRDEAIAWYQTAARSFRHGRLVEPWYRMAAGGRAPKAFAAR